MTTQMDYQLGFKKESTYGTAVVVDSFVEPTEADFQWVPEFAQGQGMRVGQRIAYADRRVKVKEEVSGSFTVEARTKGAGKLVEAVLGGTGTSTLISGTSYQQLFTPTTTDSLSSYTFQAGVPPVGGGTTLPETFAGMLFEGFEFTAGNASIPEFKFDCRGKSVTTATALATASYATDTLFSFSNVTVTIGGVVTVPTTTAIATGGTSTSNVSDFSLSYSNSLDTGGFNFGSSGAKSRASALGGRTITGSITAEFDAVTLRDAYLNQTDLAMVVTLTGATAISGANYPVIQFTMPNIRLEGELPNPAGGDIITQSIDFTVLDGRVAAHPFYVAIVTAETAI